MKISKYPYNVSRLSSPRMKNEINSLDIDQYDYLYCDQTPMAQFCHNVNIRKILNAMDSMSMNYLRESKKEKNFALKIDYFLEGIKYRNYERKIFNNFNKVTLTSEIDKEHFVSFTSHENIEVIPNGVDVDYFNPDETSNILEVEYSLLFTGIMDYLPNARAVMSFYNNEFKELQKIFKSIKFFAVGKNPSIKMEKLSLLDDSFVITGYVKDIRTYFAQASVYICPLLTGSGIKNKLLEAMSMRKAIVSTTVSSEGIEKAVNGKNMFIANNKQEFVNHVVTLLKDKQLREKMGNEARKCVLNNYSWASMSSRLNSLFVYSSFMILYYYCIHFI